MSLDEKESNPEPKMNHVHTPLYTFKGCFTSDRLFFYINSEVPYVRFAAYVSQHLTDITA